VGAFFSFSFFLGWLVGWWDRRGFGGCGCCGEDGGFGVVIVVVVLLVVV
jgi:hypothetical protein